MEFDAAIGQRSLASANITGSLGNVCLYSETKAYETTRQDPACRGQRQPRSIRALCLLMDVARLARPWRSDARPIMENIFIKNKVGSQNWCREHRPRSRVAYVHGESEKNEKRANIFCRSCTANGLELAFSCVKPAALRRGKLIYSTKRISVARGTSKPNPQQE